MDNSDRQNAGDVSTSLSLLERAKKNDEDAWRRIRELYVPLVYKWCRKSGVPENAAPDVGQEVFIAVAAGLRKFQLTDEGHTFRGWLRRITRNKSVDYFRRKGNVLDAQGGSTAQMRMNEAAFEPTVPGGEDIERQEKELLWNQAFQIIATEFPDWYAEAFLRVVIKEEKAADIARELGKRSSAIFNIKSRILRRLREEFAELLE